MKILRDDLEVALNDLIVACREAAACHRSAAEQAPDRAFADGLAALAEDRAAAAGTLAAALVARDDLPSAPAEERLLLEAAARRLKSALAEGGAGVLLADCHEKEAAIAAAAATALAQELEAGLLERIETLRRDATTRLTDLEK